MTKLIVRRVARWLEWLILGVLTVTGSFLLIHSTHPLLHWAGRYVVRISPQMDLDPKILMIAAEVSIILACAGVFTGILEIWVRMMKRIG